MAKTLVSAPMDTRADRGADYLIFINYGEGATHEQPKWCLIGGQRTADLSDTRSELDATNKTSGEYGDFEAGFKTGELSMELVCYPNDEGYLQVREAYDKNLKVDILRWHAKGRSERIWCSVAEFSDSASYDDMVTTTTKFKLTGTPIYYDNMADPRIPTPSPGVGA